MTQVSTEYGPTIRDVRDEVSVAPANAIAAPRPPSSAINEVYRGAAKVGSSSSCSDHHRPDARKLEAPEPVGAQVRSLPGGWVEMPAPARHHEEKEVGDGSVGPHQPVTIDEVRLDPVEQRVRLATRGLLHPLGAVALGVEEAEHRGLQRVRLEDEPAIAIRTLDRADRGSNRASGKPSATCRRIAAASVRTRSPSTSVGTRPEGLSAR